MASFALILYVLPSLALPPLFEQSRALLGLLSDIPTTPLDANGSGWTWVRSDPVRLSFFITAVLTVAIALGYLVYHLTTKYIRKQHIRDYHSLFLGHGRTGSRLSQRCPDAGSSPVIHIQSPANGLTNGRVPNQRNNDQPVYHHSQNNLLSNASPTADLSLQQMRQEPYLSSESSAYSNKKV
ncbi:unnamed protein product [Hydatigera taeniaeformis]|uniref:Uncharacterized protein n=1 Tax=Hydatigena taeniaeformis TaxID=6205 RepID=A0A0R3X8S6_HYDTA|nr:unnamed protein product [Hydatigera taeniaeformis]